MSRLTRLFRPDGSPRSTKRRNAQRQVAVILGLGMILLLAAYVAATLYSAPRTTGNRIRYDEFLTDLKSGNNKIQSATILVADRRVVGTYDGGDYWLDYGSNDASSIFGGITQALAQTNVAVNVDQQWLKGLLSGPQITILLPTLILVGSLLLTFLLAQSGGLRGFGRSGSRRVREGESKITFGDVAGVDEALEELVEIRDFLSNPDRFLAMGARIPRGILLVGPPGCGKTLLARAVAGEAEAQFFSISGSAFVEMYVGVGAARIRDLFREAQEAAPSIVFIDELDAVGRGRTASAVGGQDERESTLNQLLVGLDGFDRESGVVVIAATNRPDVLDSALLRPGRFDRRVIVEPPDLAGRVGILKVHVRGKPLAADVDLENLARRTPGFSGADLAGVVNEAALLAARRNELEITNRLLWEAVERVLTGPERRSKLLGPKEKRLAAYHEAGHALVTAVLNPHDRVSKISIMARGRHGGMTWYDPVEESQLSSRGQLVARLVTFMGGRAAEEVVLGEESSGSEGDLERAATLARRMVRELGMSRRLGPISLKITAAELQSESGVAQPSPEMAALVDGEVRELLNQALTSARGVLEANRDWLDRLAVRLQEVESLDGEELEALIYPPTQGAASAPPASRLATAVPGGASAKD